MKKKNITLLTAAALMAAVASLGLVWAKKQERRQLTPHKDAPQLPINNPGDQSEFPAAPSGEKELG